MLPGEVVVVGVGGGGGLALGSCAGVGLGGVKGCADGDGGAVAVAVRRGGVNGSAFGEGGCVGAVGGGWVRGGVGARSGRLAGLSLVGLMVVVGMRLLLWVWGSGGCGGTARRGTIRGGHCGFRPAALAVVLTADARTVATSAAFASSTVTS